MWGREIKVTFGVTPQLLNILERVCIIVERCQLNQDTITEELQKINRRLDNMPTQADIDNLTAAVEAAKTEITTKIAEESQQVQDFIAAHPDLDTSALESAVAGLGSIGASVDAIMADAAPEPPPVEPPV